MLGDAKGNVKAIEMVKTRLGEYDISGRSKPVPTDEIQRFECDSVIFAVGETLDLDFARASGLRLKESGTIEVNRFTLETSRPRFYAGGDVVTGASNVSNAMAYGKQAARNIDQQLMEGDRWEQLVPEDSSTARRAPRRTRVRAGGSGSRCCRPAARASSEEEVVTGLERHGRPG